MKFSIKWFTEDIALKGLSVLIAAFLWYLVNFTGSSGLSIQVPIEFRNVPPRFEILWESSQTVTVWLSGQERILRNLSTESVKAWIDLSNDKPGESYHQMNASNLETPPNVTVDRISPSVIRVLLEPVVTKDLSVAPQTEGQPAPGFEVTGIETVPRTVVAEGVRRFIAEDRDIMTEKINIAGASSDLTVQAKLLQHNSSSRIAPDSVKVTIRVAPRGEERPAAAKGRR